MSMVFSFKMLSDENDNFVRDYLVSYDMTLLDFHKFICGDLRYEEENMVSFFKADALWERLQEFTLMDMGEDPMADELLPAPVPMDSVTLGQVIHDKHDRLIYLFDMFGERAMYLELMEAKKAVPGESYPRVAYAEAMPPDQYDPNAIPDEGGSIFDDVMGDFKDFEGDELYDDE